MNKDKEQSKIVMTEEEIKATQIANTNDYVLARRALEDDPATEEEMLRTVPSSDEDND